MMQFCIEIFKYEMFIHSFGKTNLRRFIQGAKQKMTYICMQFSGPYTYRRTGVITRIPQNRKYLDKNTF